MRGSQETDDTTTKEKLKQHYEIEKMLANRLRNADKLARQKLYASVYEELFGRVPFHPMLIRKTDPKATERTVGAQMRLLRRFLTPGGTFLEVGAGDCGLSFEVARHVGTVYAVDVSREITTQSMAPRNFQLIVTEGCNIPLPPNSVDIAYSNQMIEHLHPEDAVDHVRMIYDVLAPGGVYVCVTPNRLSGPHDVSRQFDRVPTGLHLREYTNGELSELFSAAGFTRIRAAVALKGRFALVPSWTVTACEAAVEKLPYPMRRTLAGGLPFRGLLGIWMTGRKQERS